VQIPVRSLETNIIRSIREALLEEKRALNTLRAKRGRYKDYPKIADVPEVTLTYLIFKHLLKRRELRGLCIRYEDYYPRTSEEIGRRKYADIVISLTPSETKWAYIECKKFRRNLVPKNITGDRDKLIDAMREKENEDNIRITAGYLLILSEDSNIQHVTREVEGLKYVGGSMTKGEGLSFGLFQVTRGK